MEECEVPVQFMILTLGGTREVGSHKRFNLAKVIEIFCGTLTGTGDGPHRRQGNAHSFIALDIEQLLDLTEFKQEMGMNLGSILDCEPTDVHERVVYATVLEHEVENDHERGGIPYHPKEISWLREFQTKQGIECSLSD